MQEYLKIGWRNIWRNKRRTLITTASVFFAVFLAITMRGFHEGMWNTLLENVLHSYSGYLQVHAKGYWNDRTLDYGMVLNDTLKRQILGTRNVKDIIPRLESFALASSGEKTKGVMVAGVDPVLENRFTRLDEKLRSGRFLIRDDQGAVLSERLAKFLGLTVGDTLTLLSQGYQGVTAAGIFPVRGIVKLPSPEWDNQMVYIELNHARKLYSADSMITSLVIDLLKPRLLERTAGRLDRKIDLRRYEVMTWKQMLVELYQQWQIDTASAILILGLLYLIIGFGIFGTVMMMTTERIREFGIMIAVGLRREKLAGILLAELFYITFIGAIAGLIFSLPIILYFRYHPISFSADYAKMMEIYGMEPVMTLAWQADYIIHQALVVVAITVIAVLYPVFSVWKMNLSKALK